MKKLYIVSLVILINLQLLYAQNINRKTSDLQINVNTESLEKSIQPHDNKFGSFININTSADIEKLERL